MGTAVVTVVAQHAETIVFDRDALLERACELIVDAGQAGAGWIIFPELYLPGAPAWLWSGPDDGLANELQALALTYAVVIPSDVSDRLCRVEQRSRVGVAMGLVERDNGTCYNSLLIINAEGRICGHYRVPLEAGSQQRPWTPVNSSILLPSERLHSTKDWTNVGGI